MSWGGSLAEFRPTSTYFLSIPQNEKRPECRAATIAFFKPPPRSLHNLHFRGSIHIDHSDPARFSSLHQAGSPSPSLGSPLFKFNYHPRRDASPSHDLAAMKRGQSVLARPPDGGIGRKSPREQRNASAHKESAVDSPADLGIPCCLASRHEAVIALKWTWVTRRPPLPHAE